ncbi:MAG: hypothetical protein WCC66_04730 [Rhizobiaceae bacterium]
MRLILVLMAFLCPSLSMAQEDLPAPVKFGDGEITFARGEDEEIAVSFKGLEIYRNYFVMVDRLVKVGSTDVALLLGGEGGNACAPATLIITQPEGSVDAKVEIVGEDCGSPPAAVGANEILFVPFLVPGAKAKVESWTPEGGLAIKGEMAFLPKEGSSWASLEPAKADHPFGLLDNADVYAATQELVGDKFSELMVVLGVSGQAEIIEGKYVAAPGCQAHACGVANGFLGLDLEKKQVFAAVRNSGTETIFWPADIAVWPEPLMKAWEASITQ